MRVRIDGKQWHIDFVPYVSGSRKGHLRGDKGSCSRPDLPPRKIKIREDLRGLIVLDTVIHEVLHASNWTLDEEFVTQFATDCARILQRPDIWYLITGRDTRDGS